jgi:spermidine/putrescine transport system permease protein
MARRYFDIRTQPGFVTIAFATFFLLYLPMVALVAYAFNASESMTSWGGLSLRWFGAAWQNDAVKDAAWRSFVIGVSAATVATVAATMAALATTRTPRYPGLGFKYAFINQPLMVPEIVTAVALLIVFSRTKVWTGYSGLGYLILAHTAFCIPFAYLPIDSKAWTSRWSAPLPIFTPRRGWHSAG